MKRSARLALFAGVASLFVSALSAVTIDPPGVTPGTPGVWTADWDAAIQTAKANGTFYLINFGKTTGCAFCDAARLGIWEQPEFTQWATDNGIALVYANRVDTSTQPGVAVKSTYGGLQYYPTILIVDGSGTGKNLIGEFLCRYNNKYNGIKINLTPTNFIAVVNSFVNPGGTVATNDAWDASAANPAGDETYASATPLAMDAALRLHGPHTLINTDTNDWFAFTNLVAGQHYRVAVTNLTMASAVVQMAFYSDAASAASGASWTNVPLQQMTKGIFFAATASGKGYVQVVRAAAINPTVGYTLTYRTSTNHLLVVNDGSEVTTNEVNEGDAQPVTAAAPEAGTFFSGWSVSPVGAALGTGFSASQSNTTVTMPAYDVTLTATTQAETRVIALSGSLAFGNVLINQSSQAAFTVANNGNQPLTVTAVTCPDGFVATPTNLTVAAGGSSRVTVTFSPTVVTNYGGNITVDSDATSGANTIACSGNGLGNQPPVFTSRTPTNNPAMIAEGASSTFAATASDSTDPNVAARGMASITWFVNGTQKLVTTNGAPNAIASTFTFKTDTNTVQGVASNGITVKAVALDKQGGTTETTWTLWVSNLQAAQTIKFLAIPLKALGDPDFTPATASSGLPVVYTSSNTNVAVMVAGVVHITGAGSAVITASQPGNADYKAAAPVNQTLTVRVRLSADVAGGSGSVTGAGLYAPGARVPLTAKASTGYTFLHWEDASQTATRSLVMPNANVSVSAYFGITTNILPPTIGAPGSQEAMVGVPFGLPLDIQSDSLPTVTATGLPTGLRYDAASKSVIGVPTVPVTNRTVTLTARNVNKTPAVQTFAITIDPLPVWAQGSFNGAFDDPHGPISADVTAQGGVSGKFTCWGTNYPFSAASFAFRDEAGAFWVTCTAKVGAVTFPLTLAVRPPSTDVVPPTLSRVDGWFASTATDSATIGMFRNVWKDQGMPAVETNYAGYYTATLPGTNAYGSGYLTFTVDKAGGVKTAGKLADGTAVSLSGPLILDDNGRVFTVLYTAPAAYMGGCFFGLAEFVRSDVGGATLVQAMGPDSLLLWESRNPQATADYAAGGFTRELGLNGGWYDTVGNLYNYYTNVTLTVGTDADAAAPEIIVGTNRYASVWWDPNGLALSVVTNKAGVLTGLAAPKAGVPVSLGGNAYDYNGPTNTVGLTIALTRATGVFTGTFKAWFDYAATHTSKTITYQGVLTPVPQGNDPADDTQGRGFFLWADRAPYVTKAGTYSFNGSYDFLILAPCDDCSDK